MNAEDFAFNNGSNTEIVKDLSAVLPGVGITVLSDSFIVEPVNSGNLSGFVISSQESDVGWVL
jgi:hypothetical protein